jgi:hypothetical protein
VTVSATQIFTLFVNESPSITTAASEFFLTGTPKSFAVAATGFPTPTLSEIGPLPSGLSFDPASGVLSGTAAPGTGGTYPITFKARNGVGSDALQSFTVIIGIPPVITSANTVTFGMLSQGSFTVSASGLPAPTLSESGTLPSGVTFDPATGDLSGTPAVGTAGNYPITFRAHNEAGADSVQNFTLVVFNGTIPPSINSANNVSFLLGRFSSFKVSTTGSPAPTLSVAGTLPSGITFNTSTAQLRGTPAAGTLGVYPLTFTATNSVGSVDQSFTLTINALPSITTQPVNQSVNVGQTATVSVVASGSPPLTFQWQRNGVDIPDATSSSYTTPVTTAADDNAQYSVIVSNALGSAFSNTVTLRVASPPQITQDPLNKSIATGQKGTFTVTVNVTGGLPLSYQWMKNGANISGATSSIYTTPSATLADNDAQYRVKVSNSLGSVTSNPATLTVTSLPSQATYYVDAVSGDDTNSGLTKTGAWKHAPGMTPCAYNCGLTSLRPGDKVVFKGGVIWDYTNFPMTLTRSGNSSNRISYGVDPTWFDGAHPAERRELRYPR